MQVQSLPDGAAVHAAPNAERFARDGFLSIPDAIDPHDVREVRALIDPLFARFEELPKHLVHDVGGDGGKQRRSPEVHRATYLEPQLLGTAAFRRCAAIARELLGPGARFVADHAIYKPPFNGRATAWHQDFAYSPGRPLPRAVHLWLPLQDTPVEAGCMRFVPRSHHTGLVAHEYVAADPNNLTLGVRHIDEADAVVCPLRMGGLTAHAPLTLHAAGGNSTADTRRAWILHFHAPAPLRVRMRGVLERLTSLVRHRA